MIISFNIGIYFRDNYGSYFILPSFGLVYNKQLNEIAIGINFLKKSVGISIIKNEKIN